MKACLLPFISSQPTRIAESQIMKPRSLCLFLKSGLSILLIILVAFLCPCFSFDQNCTPYFSWGSISAFGDGLAVPLAIHHSFSISHFHLRISQICELSFFLLMPKCMLIHFALPSFISLAFTFNLKVIHQQLSSVHAYILSGTPYL